MSGDVWHMELCVCRCLQCGDGIWECACDDLEIDHECDCSESYGDSEEGATA